MVNNMMIFDYLDTLFIFFFFFLFLYNMILGQYYKFLLLKEIYPSKAQGVNNWFSFKAYIFKMQFHFGIQIWYGSPIYFTQFPLETLNKEALKYHYKLKKISTRIIVYFILFMAVPIIARSI